MSHCWKTQERTEGSISGHWYAYFDVDMPCCKPPTGQNNNIVHPLFTQIEKPHEASAEMIRKYRETGDPREIIAMGYHHHISENMNTVSSLARDYADLRPVQS